MRVIKHNKEYILKFLMDGNSLHDLLGILANVSENLDLDYLNPRLKHFRYFQFTFFGLMVKAKGLLEMMVYREEFLKNNDSEFDETYRRLLKLKKTMERAYNLINKNKMVEGKNKIIECSKEYQNIFENINKTASRMLLK